ncbi:hypothetical protein [Algoriphagus confluentis]|uniref:Small multi-drug export protein n=1 Tax=Algoriphagus confluentis TaxID=1697556 RepID=A0ABQ6PTD2_9BACT|nr:hypothetical protein Aconfl_38800 [Algoriphagus confluentis]
MNESVLTFFGIYVLSLFKFISGPVLGYAAGYSFFESVFVTLAGMMTSVFVFTLIGTEIKKMLEKRFIIKRVVFTKKSRRIVQIWQKTGIIGIAFLTPLILTPIGGTLILVSFGTQKRKIFFYMFISGLFWASFFSLTIEQLLAIPFFQNLIG